MFHVVQVKLRPLGHIAARQHLSGTNIRWVHWSPACSEQLLVAGGNWAQL